MLSLEMNSLFLVLLFVVAFLYAAVGHGGASGYLALMALFSFAPSMMKSSALLLNIVVSLIAFIQYYRGGYFKWKLFIPFAISSIPAAFIGSLIIVDPLIYKRILGVLLIFPILLLFGFIGKEKNEIKQINIFVALLMGAIIGMLSGMMGIGGGIILGPFILMAKWGNMKQTAAVCALFIFVNSIAGIIGLVSKGLSINSAIYGWLLITFTGGLIGAYLGRKKFSNVFLKRVLAIVLVIASVKLLMV